MLETDFLCKKGKQQPSVQHCRHSQMLWLLKNIEADQVLWCLLFDVSVSTWNIPMLWCFNGKITWLSSVIIIQRSQCSCRNFHLFSFFREYGVWTWCLYPRIFFSCLRSIILTWLSDETSWSSQWGGFYLFIFKACPAHSFSYQVINLVTWISTSKHIVMSATSYKQTIYPHATLLPECFLLELF